MGGEIHDNPGRGLEWTAKVQESACRRQEKKGGDIHKSFGWDRDAVLESLVPSVGAGALRRGS